MLKLLYYGSFIVAWRFTDMKVLDVTYDMYVQNSAAGVLKRSGMDVDVNLGNTTLPLYSVF